MVGDDVSTLISFPIVFLRINRRLPSVSVLIVYPGPVFGPLSAISVIALPEYLVQNDSVNGFVLSKSKLDSFANVMYDEPLKSNAFLNGCVELISGEWSTYVSVPVTVP